MTDLAFYADAIRKGDDPEAVLTVVAAQVQQRALNFAAETIRDEVRGWEQGGSYARKKHAMYEGLASRVRACLDASNE